MQERVTGMDEKKETSTSNTKQSIGSCVKFVFSFIHLVFWSSPDLAARTPFRALLTSSPKHCALQLIAHCALISDIPAAQYGAEGGDESTASFGIAAKATEPVAVAVPALLFFSAAPTPQGSWRVLAPERERRRPGRRRESLWCLRQQWWYMFQRPRELRTDTLRQSYCACSGAFRGSALSE